MAFGKFQFLKYYETPSYRFQSKEPVARTFSVEAAATPFLYKNYCPWEKLEFLKIFTLTYFSGEQSNL